MSTVTTIVAVGDRLVADNGSVVTITRVEDNGRLAVELTRGVSVSRDSKRMNKGRKAREAMKEAGLT